jgi:hypothetical protein
VASLIAAEHRRELDEQRMKVEKHKRESDWINRQTRHLDWLERHEENVLAHERLSGARRDAARLFVGLPHDYQKVGVYKALDQGAPLDGLGRFQSATLARQRRLRCTRHWWRRTGALRSWRQNPSEPDRHLFGRGG